MIGAKFAHDRSARTTAHEKATRRPPAQVARLKLEAQLRRPAPYPVRAEPASSYRRREKGSLFWARPVAGGDDPVVARRGLRAWSGPRRVSLEPIDGDCPCCATRTTPDCLLARDRVAPDRPDSRSRLPRRALTEAQSESAPMSKPASQTPKAKTERLIVREIDSETLVYDRSRDAASCLNRCRAGLA